MRPRDHRRRGPETGSVPVPDAALVLAALRGDRTAFDRLALVLGPPLVRAVRRVLAGDEATALDVVQDAFLVAWRSPPTLRRPSLLSGWLYRVARNRAVSQLRHRHLKRRRPLPDGSTFSSIRFFCDVRSDAEAAAELRGFLEASLAEIPTDLAAALRLVYLHGLRTRDAAYLLGVTRSALRARLHRGRVRLRSQMARR